MIVLLYTRTHMHDSTFLPWLCRRLHELEVWPCWSWWRGRSSSVWALPPCRHTWRGRSDGWKSASEARGGPGGTSPASIESWGNIIHTIKWNCNYLVELLFLTTSEQFVVLWFYLFRWSRFRMSTSAEGLPELTATSRALCNRGKKLSNLLHVQESITLPSRVLKHSLHIITEFDISAFILQYKRMILPLVHWQTTLLWSPSTLHVDSWGCHTHHCDLK